MRLWPLLALHPLSRAVSATLETTGLLLPFPLSVSKIKSTLPFCFVLGITTFFRIAAVKLEEATAVGAVAAGAVGAFDGDVVGAAVEPEEPTAVGAVSGGAVGAVDGDVRAENKLVAIYQNHVYCY